MAAAVYLEQYLDSLEGLPLELQRNFSLMRDVDRRAQDVMKEIDKQADSFLASVNKLSSDDKKKRFGKMEQLFSKSQEFGDEKVQLAFQTYEMVDKHIRKLDNDLARFEAELNDKNLQVEATPVEKGKKKRKKKEEEPVSSKGQKRKKKETSKENTSLMSPMSMHSQPSDVLDMPVDPNEPTYCICHQVSYGEMIGCDNQDCPIEWFHFQCVNLTTKPKGKWYCPRCSEQRKKR